MVEDECGVCGGKGIKAGKCDCDGNVDKGCGCGKPGPTGCNKKCGSTMKKEECGVCGGKGIPDGDCACGGKTDRGCGCGKMCPANICKKDVDLRSTITLRSYKVNGKCVKMIDVKQGDRVVIDLELFNK